MHVKVGPEMLPEVTLDEAETRTLLLANAIIKEVLALRSDLVGRFPIGAKQPMEALKMVIEVYGDTDWDDEEGRAGGEGPRE